MEDVIQFFVKMKRKEVRGMTCIECGTPVCDECGECHNKQCPQYDPYCDAM